MPLPARPEGKGRVQWPHGLIQGQALLHAPQREAGSHSDLLGKFAVMGALTLYLDFINLFTFLLQLTGDRPLEQDRVGIAPGAHAG